MPRLVLFQPAAPSSPAPSASAGTPEGRETEFRAVTGAEGEARSGAVLLTEAFAFTLLAIFVFVWLGWSRQKKLDARVGELAAALAKARADEGGGAAPAERRGAGSGSKDG